MNFDFTDVPKHYAARTHEKMVEVLMDPQGIGPVVHYYMIRGGVGQRNITVLEPGTVSQEYIKTYGHYHVGKLDETYWFIFGEGIALLQKLALDETGGMMADVVEEFKAIPMHQGQDLFIPSNYGHLVVNTGNTYFVTADDSPVNFDERDAVTLPGHADYDLVKKTQGFAYYVVEHEGKPALKRNPRYRSIKQETLNGIPVVG